MIEFELYVLLKLAFPGPSIPPVVDDDPDEIPRCRCPVADFALLLLPKKLPFPLYPFADGRPDDDPSLESDIEPAGMTPGRGRGGAACFGEEWKSEVRDGERNPFLVFEPDGSRGVVVEVGEGGRLELEESPKSLVLGALATLRSHLDAAPPPPP